MSPSLAGRIHMQEVKTIADVQFTEYLSPELIAHRIQSMAQQIDEHYAGIESIVVIIVMKGAFIFAADLVRQMTTPMIIEMIQASSYKGGMSSTGTVSFFNLNINLSGKHILIIEDIIDSGRTVTELKKYASSQNIASCMIAALCSKSDQHTLDLNNDCIGFEIPNVFIVGYGLDYQEQGRELPGIWQCIS